MKAFEVYGIHLAMKQHFSPGTYDYHKYNGKLKLNRKNFSTNKDRFLYERLGRKFQNQDQDLFNFILANVMENPNIWIKSLLSEKSMAIYKTWQARNESLAYNFEQEMKQLQDQWPDKSFNDLFACTDGQHCPILVSYAQDALSAETIILLDYTLGHVLSRWEASLDDPIWDAANLKFRQYQNFVVETKRQEHQKFKAILQKVFLP